MTGETYPTDNNSTANLSYTFDSMGRLNRMTDNIASQTLVSASPTVRRTSPGITA